MADALGGPEHLIVIGPLVSITKTACVKICTNPFAKLCKDIPLLKSKKSLSLVQWFRYVTKIYSRSVGRSVCRSAGRSVGRSDGTCSSTDRGSLQG